MTSPFQKSDFGGRRSVWQSHQEISRFNPEEQASSRVGVNACQQAVAVLISHNRFAKPALVNKERRAVARSSFLALAFSERVFFCIKGRKF